MRFYIHQQPTRLETRIVKKERLLCTCDASVFKRSLLINKSSLTYFKLEFKGRSMIAIKT